MTHADHLESQARHLVLVAEGYLAADNILRAAEHLERAAALLRQAHREREIDPANLCVEPPNTVLRERA